MGLDWTYHVNWFHFLFFIHFLFVPFGRLSCLLVGFWLHVKYTLSYRNHSNLLSAFMMVFTVCDIILFVWLLTHISLSGIELNELIDYNKQQLTNILVPVAHFTGLLTLLPIRPGP